MSREQDNPRPTAEIDALADEWPTFRAHHPVGAYLPVGQLDGDCKCGRGAWPCDAVREVLSRVFSPEKTRPT
jgi:hypothetical protein